MHMANTGDMKILKREVEKEVNRERAREKHGTLSNFHQIKILEDSVS